MNPITRLFLKWAFNVIVRDLPKTAPVKKRARVRTTFLSNGKRLHEIV
jgi:hypothetical protein